jgi:hypothetical protein
MALLSSTSFARVGVSVEALPAILPVTITLDDERIVFRTVPGTKLAHAAAGAILAVEADAFDPVAGDGWSVLVRGVATELRDAAEIARVGALLRETWIGPDTAEHYVGVSCDLVTGRRLSSSATPRSSPAP